MLCQFVDLLGYASRFSFNLPVSVRFRKKEAPLEPIQRLRWA